MRNFLKEELDKIGHTFKEDMLLVCERFEVDTCKVSVDGSVGESNKCFCSMICYNRSLD